jgi:hypothetical protein
VTLVIGRGLLQDFVWMWIHPDTDVVRSWTAVVVVAEQVPVIQRELALSFGSKFSCERGNVADSIRGYFLTLSR